jgi:TetR/AcrR family transcriptional regulator
MVKIENVPMSTEAKILQSAREIFMMKGLDGARMQEIADHAGINKALLHYYFRNKESLFHAVFNQTVAELIPNLTGVFRSDRPLLEKIPLFFNIHMTFIQENPLIPYFIISELTRNPEMIINGFRNFLPNELFAKFSDDVRQSVERGEIRPVEPLDLLVNLLSLSVFPFLAKPLLVRMLPLTDSTFDSFIEHRKREVSNFVINAIK